MPICDYCHCGVPAGCDFCGPCASRIPPRYWSLLLRRARERDAVKGQPGESRACYLWGDALTQCRRAVQRAIDAEGGK